MLDPAILQELLRLPPNWRFTPVNDKKAPYLPQWQKNPLTAKELIDRHASDSSAYAVGLLTGTVSQGIISIDHDGSSCDILIERLSRLTLNKALPITVGFTSSKPGRHQLLYQIPLLFINYIVNKTLITGVKDADGKEEQLDLRWNGKQCVILGKHPETGAYRWMGKYPPFKIAECPKWLIRQALTFRHLVKTSHTEWGDREWALEYLNWIVNEDLEWHQWRDALLALHHSGVESQVALVWSASSDKHTDRGFYDVWQHIKDDKPEGENLTVAYLGKLAKEKGRRGSSPAKPPDELDEDLQVDTERLLAEASQDFDISCLLHPKLAKPLTEISEVFNQSPTVAVTCLLAIAASLLTVGTRIRIANLSQYEQPPLIWACLVGDSDAGKSPLINILKKPLNYLQSQSYQSYQERKANYEWEVAEWEAQQKKDRGAKPKLIPMRQFTFDDFTTEAIAQALKHYPERGALVCIDELAGLINGFDRYRKRGNDRQQWLSLYDGNELNIVRKTQESVYLSKTNLPILGGIQPCVLRTLMGDLDYVDGFWTRFLYIALRQSVMPPIDWDRDRDTGIGETLSHVYERINELPAIVYGFAPDCRPVWDIWHSWTEQEQFNEFYPALRAIYRKARARAARIALIIHCLNATVENRIPEEQISSATLKAAIAFTKYGIDQIRSIYADFGLVDNPEFEVMTVFQREMLLTGFQQGINLVQNRRAGL